MLAGLRGFFFVLSGHDKVVEVVDGLVVRAPLARSERVRAAIVGSRCAGKATFIAAAIQDPSVPTVLAVGDGGIAPFVGEAHLAGRLNLPLLVLHMSDGGYGSVRTRAIADGLPQEPMLQPAGSWRPSFDGFGFSDA